MSIKTNLLIEQGATFNIPITLTDQNGENLDVTHFSANASLRKFYTSTNSVTFDTTLANGSLTLGLTAVVTANIVAGRYVYDVILTNAVSNTISRLLEGIVTVTPRVTQ